MPSDVSHAIIPLTVCDVAIRAKLTGLSSALIAAAAWLWRRKAASR